MMCFVFQYSVYWSFLDGSVWRDAINQCGGSGKLPKILNTGVLGTENSKDLLEPEARFILLV